MPDHPLPPLPAAPTPGVVERPRLLSGAHPLVAGDDARYTPAGGRVVPGAGTGSTLLHLLSPKWLTARARAATAETGRAARYALLGVIGLGFWAFAFGALYRVLAYFKGVEEIGALPPGSTIGMVCSSTRSTANMVEWLATSGRETRLIEAVAGDEAMLTQVDREADLLLLTREALEIGLAPRFGRPERIREWTYDLDPAGLELLRLAIERVRATRARGA